MTMQIEAAPPLMPRQVRPLAAPALPPWISITVLFVVAVVLRHLLASNTDVSWLLTVGERVLDGQRLYVDVIETNPPMAVLVYIPAIVIAREFGLPVEAVTDGLVFASIFVSLAIVARILKNSGVVEGLNGWRLASFVFFVLAILPMQTFGQREHITMVELLPLLALFAVRMKGEKPSAWLAVIAGIGAGLAVTFKPPFAIGLFCALGCLTIYLRSWKAAFTSELLTAAVVVLLYALSVVAFFPAFFTIIVPLVRDIYVPVGLSFRELFEKPPFLIWGVAIVTTIALKRHDRIDAACLLLLATSVGFAAAFLLQRKGWPYHSYPMLALAMLALGHALISDVPRTADRAFRVIAMVLFVALLMRSMMWFNVTFDARSLQAAVARLGPNPRILAITVEPGFGHPLVRALNGTWVSRQQGLWIEAYINYMRQHGIIGPEAHPELDAYAARERAMLIEDINRTRPSVVLVDNLISEGSAWLRAHPDVSSLLGDYQLAETIDGVDILRDAR
jgi:hypothetical protein